jgi:hypothetical protein
MTVKQVRAPQSKWMKVELRQKLVLNYLASFDAMDVTDGSYSKFFRGNTDANRF